MSNELEIALANLEEVFLHNRYDYDIDGNPAQLVRAALAAARRFARDIASNYDHDADAHRYGHADSQCRVCKADAFIATHT